jgi:hypothetical protein
MYDLDLYNRIETRSIPEPNTGCWLWLGGLTVASKHGRYGLLLVAGSTTTAHRAMYQSVHGPIPSKFYVVMHKCDTPQCVNPDHLQLGTFVDNMQDCKRKGRAAQVG